MRFAACQHHFPENFWNPAFQIHPNGALKASGVAMVADNPTDHHIFLKAFAGVSDLHSSSIGIKARSGDADLEIIEPVSFRDRFGVAPAVDGEGMTLNGVRFPVADIAVAETLQRQAGIASRRHAGCLVIPPAVARGATLIFEPANDRGLIRPVEWI